MCDENGEHTLQSLNFTLELEDMVLRPQRQSVRM